MVLKMNKKEILIPFADIFLKGILALPENCERLVLFVHGSGSSRLSTRNQYVANVLNESNIATLLFDLLTSDEEQIDDVTRKLRFNIPFLTERLIAVTHWINNYLNNTNLHIGYFGASTGAAAALQAAAQIQTIYAIVSRGGRPDLAGEALKSVAAPTLLIVGGNDEEVIELNKQAQQQMVCKTKLKIVPGATHLFEEKGALEIVAGLARDWFLQ